jgi:hypothetical protein
MRLASRAASVLLVAALLLPAAADAAAKAKAIRLRDVAKILQTNGKPLSFEGTVKTTQGKNKGTVTVKGVQNGTMDSIEDAALQMTLVADATFDGDNVRATIDAIVVDATMYAKLSGVSATGDAADLAALAEPYADTWVRIPLDPGEYAADDEPMPSLRKFDQFFAIEKTTKNGADRYAITIPQEKKRRFLTAVMGVADGYASSYRAALRRAVRSTTLDFSMTVDARANVFQAMAATIGVKTTVDGEKSAFAFTGKTAALAAPPAITAPETSVPLEELFGSEDF